MNILKAQRKNHMLFVSHTWSISYLMRNKGAHYRKFLKVFSKRISLTGSDWVGNVIWGSPIVALAPPFTLVKMRNDVYVRECSSRAAPYVILGISKGAKEAMISYPKGKNEIKNYGKPRQNPKRNKPLVRGVLQINPQPCADLSVYRSA